MNMLLEMNGVRFPLRNGELLLDLQTAPGEVHALLSDASGGAPECALILGASARPTGGEWSFLGEKACFRSEKEALRAGLAVSRGLWPSLSVRDTLRLFLPDRKRREAALPALGEALPGFDPRKKTGSLSPEDRFRLLLALSRLRGDRLLVLTDPMDGLEPDFYDTAADLMKAYAGEDRGLLLISQVPRHAMLCDRCTVLRDGKKVFESPCAQTSVRQIREYMTPLDRPLPTALREKTVGAVVLEARALSGGRRRVSPGTDRVENVSLELREGEIAGLCALPGHGGEALLSMLAGSLRIGAGRLRILGKAVRRYTRTDGVRAGIRYVTAPFPAYRAGNGPMTVREAVLCGRLRNRALFSERGWLQKAAADQYVRFILEEYCPGLRPETLLENCSPDCLRMLSIAGEMDREGPVLLMDRPFLGLDGRQKALVKDCLQDEKKRRTAVLILSDQMDELIDLCDRLLVMYRGRIVLETDCLLPSRHEISLAMSGRRVSGEMVPDEEEDE